jgi:hypothetical protein
VGAGKEEAIDAPPLKAVELIDAPLPEPFDCMNLASEILPF